MNLSDPALWRAAGTLFFFLFFCGAAAWAFFSRRARNFHRDAALPLEDSAPAAQEGPSHE